MHFLSLSDDVNGDEFIHLNRIQCPQGHDAVTQVVSETLGRGVELIQRFNENESKSLRDKIDRNNRVLL